MESGLYYYEARYYDPTIGRFISQDPAEGKALEPLSYHKYLYAYANPLSYVDPDGKESVSTMIDNKAEGCGPLSCAGWALLKGAYVVSTFGFATVHDPVRDAYDQGKVSTKGYLTYGVGGGALAVAANVVTARVGGTVMQASGLAGRAGSAALSGALAGAANDAITQGSQIGAGIKNKYDVAQTATAASVGAALGGASVAVVEAATAAAPYVRATAQKVKDAVTNSSKAVGETASAGAQQTRQAVETATRAEAAVAQGSTTAEGAGLGTSANASGTKSVAATASSERAPAVTTNAVQTETRVASTNAARPGGYITNDVDRHGLLSPQTNRAPGYTNTRVDSFVQSHHPVQDKWAQQNVPGYDRNAAPAVLLESSSGSVYAAISAAQRAVRKEMKAQGLDPWGNTIRQEFDLGYKQMIEAGVSGKIAKKAIKDSYKYFDSLEAFK